MKRFTLRLNLSRPTALMSRHAAQMLVNLGKKPQRAKRHGTTPPTLLIQLQSQMHCPYSMQALPLPRDKHSRKFWKQRARLCHTFSLARPTSRVIRVRNFQALLLSHHHTAKANRFTTAFVNMPWVQPWSAWRYMVAYCQWVERSLCSLTTCVHQFD